MRPIAELAWKARLEALASFGKAAQAIAAGDHAAASDAADEVSRAFARLAGFLRLLDRSTP